MSKTRFFGSIIKTNPTLPTANSGANYGTATGVWNLEEVASFKAAGDWPVPASAPSAPSITGVTAGNAQVTVAFNAGDDGGLDVTSFTALASSGESASASSSPVTVTGLTNGTAITFTVTATNVVGTSSASSASSSTTPVQPQRGIFHAGDTGGGVTSNVIQYIDITSTGNASDFGDAHISLSNGFNGVASSSTRALFAGGRGNDQYQSRIDYVTIFSTGNASDFGDLGKSGRQGAQASNGTRALFMGSENIPSYGDYTRNIYYVTIASTGNTSSFGNLTSGRYSGSLGVANATRAVNCGGPSGAASNQMEYVTIASTGNSQDFGDMSKQRYIAMGGANGTRGLMAGDHDSSDATIDYITIASTGNSSDFGDLTVGRGSGGGVASDVRVCFAGGARSGRKNEIDYVTIASTGNATDFGDLTVAIAYMSSGCNGHGGIT